MPYIPSEQREIFDEHVDTIVTNLVTLLAAHPGALNYIITRLALGIVAEKDESYQTYNDIIGALEACKLEFYRKQVSRYERLKEEENGPVAV